MNKFQIIVESITFWTFFLVIAMLFNFSGFSQINPDIVISITSEQFNLLTFQGLSTIIQFFIGLMKFTVTGLHPLFATLVTVMALANLTAIAFFVRRS